MLVITKLIMIGIVIVCLVTFAFILLDFVTDKVKSTSSKKINRVHFYVARDMNGRLYIYLGKPVRRYTGFGGFAEKNIYVIPNTLENFGLKEDDFKDLKWEDEPVEVFLNMED